MGEPARCECVIIDEVIDLDRRPLPTSPELERLMRENVKYYRDGYEVDDPTAPVSVMCSGGKEILDEIYRLIREEKP